MSFIVLVLVVFAPVSVILFPEPLNGITVSICIAVIAAVESKREIALKEEARKDTEARARKLNRWEGSSPTIADESEVMR